jgi:hypothetical protein
MAENHLDFIFMKKDGKESQIYRVGEPELAGLLIAIGVTTGKTNNAFNEAINTYIARINSLDPLLKADEPAHDAETLYNRAHPGATKTYELAVYFNTSNTDRFGTMHPVTYAADGEITTVADAVAVAVGPMTGLAAAEYQILKFTQAEIVLLKSINKGNGLENLATKIQLVTQSFRQLYDKIPDNTTAKEKITAIINAAVAAADFPAYCGLLVDIGMTYDKGTEIFEGVSVELDISYPAAAGAIPEIKSQQAITNLIQVNNLFNFAITCLGAKETKLTGGYKIGGKGTKRRNKSSKRRSQKKSRKIRKLRKRSNKRKGKKSRRRMRKSYKK